MKIFVSFRFTGEDMDKLRKFMKGVCLALEEAGHKQYCNFWKPNYKEPKMTHKQIIYNALEDLDDADCYLAVIKSDEKSEGMLIEAGYALAKGKRKILAIKKSVKTTFMRDIVDEIIEFKNFRDLCNKLRKLK